MEHVQQEATDTNGKRVKGFFNRFKPTHAEKPTLKDLFRTFCQKMKSLSLVQKINLAYTKVVKKKPDPILTPDKQLERILFELEYGEKVKKSKQASKKKFKWPVKWKRTMRRSRKKDNKILILYYTIKGDIIPMLLPIWSGDTIIIRSKPYEVDPRAFWRLGKYRCMSFREIDRRPISNLDYDYVKRRGDSTSSDEFLIKAALRAFVGGIKKQVNRTVAIAIGIAIVAAIIWFMLGA